MRTGGSATRGTPWNRACILSRGRSISSPAGMRYSIARSLIWKRGTPGMTGRGEVAVVAEDVDALAVVGSAEDRLDALRAQHIELAAGRSGDDDAFLAAPDGNGSIMEDRLQVAREHRDPRWAGGDGSDDGADTRKLKSRCRYLEPMETPPVRGTFQRSCSPRLNDVITKDDQLVSNISICNV